MPAAPFSSLLLNTLAEGKHLGLAMKILEKLGGYELKLRSPDGNAPVDDGEVHQRLIAEYYVLRTAAVTNSWSIFTLHLTNFHRHGIKIT